MAKTCTRANFELFARRIVMSFFAGWIAVICNGLRLRTSRWRRRPSTWLSRRSPAVTRSLNPRATGFQQQVVVARRHAQSSVSMPDFSLAASNRSATTMFPRRRFRGVPAARSTHPAAGRQCPSVESRSARPRGRGRPGDTNAGRPAASTCAIVPSGLVAFIQAMSTSLPNETRPCSSVSNGTFTISLKSWCLIWNCTGRSASGSPLRPNRST